MRIIHFEDVNIQFINDSIDRAIKDLPADIITYTYDDLRNNRVNPDSEACVLFLEAGQAQPIHSGWGLKKFKYFFSNSKIVLWASDTQYYRVNKLGLQTGDPELIDLVFELTPACVSWWEENNVLVTTIPWTIPRSIYN